MAIFVQLLFSVSTITPYHYRSCACDTDHCSSCWWTQIVAKPVHNAIILISELVIFLILIYRLYPHCAKLVCRRRRVARGTRKHGVDGFMKTVNMLFCLLYVTGWAFRLGGLHDVEDIFLSLASLVGWAYILTFLIGFRSTGPFIIMLNEILLKDLGRFIPVIVIVMIGYTRCSSRCACATPQFHDGRAFVAHAAPFVKPL